MATNVYVHRTNGAICRVVEVNESYARLSISYPDGTQSAYSMPVKEYDAGFADSWRPAMAEDFATGATGSFRPPTGAASPSGEA